MNYIAASSAHSFYLESVMTSYQRHHRKFIAHDITQVICKYDNTAFVYARTNNTYTNKKMLKLLQEMSPLANMRDLLLFERR